MLNKMRAGSSRGAEFSDKVQPTWFPRNDVKAVVSKVRLGKQMRVSLLIDVTPAAAQDVMLFRSRSVQSDRISHRSVIAGMRQRWRSSLLIPCPGRAGVAIGFGFVEY
jgi:hypothetical protein